MRLLNVLDHQQLAYASGLSLITTNTINSVASLRTVASGPIHLQWTLTLRCTHYWQQASSQALDRNSYDQSWQVHMLF